MINLDGRNDRSRPGGAGVAIAVREGPVGPLRGCTLPRRIPVLESLLTNMLVGCTLLLAAAWVRESFAGRG
jgi:hypothetical protein